jgi:hypothetical protein
MAYKVATYFVIAVLLASVLLLGVVYVQGSERYEDKWTMVDGKSVSISGSTGDMVPDSNFDIVVISQNDNLFYGKYGDMNISGGISNTSIWFFLQFPTSEIEFFGYITNNKMTAQAIITDDSGTIESYSLVYTDDGTYATSDFESISGLSISCYKATMGYGKNNFRDIWYEGCGLIITYQTGGAFKGVMDQGANGNEVKVAFVGSLLPTKSDGSYTAECCDANGRYWSMNFYSNGECITMTGCFKSTFDGGYLNPMTVERIYFKGTPDYSLIPTPADIGNSVWTADKKFVMDSNGNFSVDDRDCSIIFYQQNNQLTYAYTNFGSTEDASMMACMTYYLNHGNYFIGMMDKGTTTVYVFGFLDDDDTLILYYSISNADQCNTTKVTFVRSTV